MTNEASMTTSEEQEQMPSPQPDMSEEDRSKDAFFIRLAEIVEAMIASHGKDFATGALVLSAKFVAEGKPLIRRTSGP
ncbi:hypothetical protein FBZ93_12341 [Bradyrhizobium macuxiense]|uniref:Uncharacterized protein n=2 Tax=Bradyrhizobium macuxiense TaxID=1755647 RepID=A0A560L1W6_9BRAD|nr:hypothetical protein FBZ93_12341 [Bradyrhizobium macuxiense]